MMRNSRNALLSVIALALMSPIAFGQANGTGLITRFSASQLGLERAWFAQVDLDPMQDRVKAIVLYQPGSLQDDVAYDAQLFDEARRRELSPAGVSNAVVSPVTTIGGAPIPKVENEVDVPDQQVDPDADMRSTVYVLTKLSMLQSIDAETGRTNWVRMVGDSTRPSEPPAVNHHYVAMINGSDLYVMDRESGETLWKRRLTSAPISALAVSTHWMFIPSISGSMTAMNILNPEEFWSFQSGEAVEVPPVVTRDTVAWVTRYGRMFMGEKATTRVTRRFDTTSTVSAGPVYWPPYIFLASNDGYLNAVDERSGVAVWRYATGAPIYRPPVAVDSGLFALTEPAGLHSMNQDGTQNWLSPEIVSFLSCTPGRIYAVDRAHRIVAMDRSTGRIMGALPLADQSTQLTNMVNDRIYVCTNKGLLQCLHEIGQEEPLIHKPPAPETADDTANGDQPPAAGGIDG